MVTAGIDVALSRELLKWFTIYIFLTFLYYNALCLNRFVCQGNYYIFKKANFVKVLFTNSRNYDCYFDKQSIHNLATIEPCK